MAKVDFCVCSSYCSVLSSLKLQTSDFLKKKNKPFVNNNKKVRAQLQTLVELFVLYHPKNNKMNQFLFFAYNGRNNQKLIEKVPHYQYHMHSI